MENASKALIIAGAILLSILIIAIGMYIYTSSQATVMDSMTSISTQEIEAFNSQLTTYTGNQTGSQIKALIQRLSGNAKTYDEEMVKLPLVHYNDDTNGSAVGSCDTNSPTQGDISAYVADLSWISNHMTLKHTYNVVMDTGKSGLIETITINYNKANQTGGEARQDTWGAAGGTGGT